MLKSSCDHEIFEKTEKNWNFTNAGGSVQEQRDKNQHEAFNLITFFSSLQNEKWKMAEKAFSVQKKSNSHTHWLNIFN